MAEYDRRQRDHEDEKGEWERDEAEVSPAERVDNRSGKDPDHRHACHGQLGPNRSGDEEAEAGRENQEPRG